MIAGLKNNIVKIILFVMILVLKVPISFVYAKENMEVIHAETQEEFGRELIRIINNEKENKQNTARLLVKANKKIDLNDYTGIKTVVTDDDGNYVIQFDNMHSASDAKEKLNELKIVEFVEMDEKVSIDYSVEDTYVSKASSEILSWGVKVLGTDIYSSYVYEKNKEPMLVAVVDSGIDLQHDYLQDRLKRGYDFQDEDSVPDDENGHGTHIAGTIVENTHMNSNIKILPVRVLDSRGEGYVSIVANGIRYAVDEGAVVINLSIGGNHSSVIDNAISYAVNKGTTCVVSAGNENEYIGSNACPAHISEAITVGAVDSKLNRASFSNYGKALDCVAPGVNIYSTYLNNSYNSLNGTSMAAGYITACAALIKLSNPEYTPEQISEQIIWSCKDLGNSGKDDYYGHGIVDMTKLLENEEDNTQCSHNMEYIPKEDADCQNSGYKEYYYCSICGGKYKDEFGKKSVNEKELYIAPLGHKYNDGTLIKKASTNENGVIEYICIRESCQQFKESGKINRIATMELDAYKYQYTGKRIIPTVIVYDADDKVISSDYYSVQYENNVEKGIGKVKLTFYDLYTGSMSREFKIQAVKLPVAKLSKSSFEYTGSVPNLNVIFEGYKLIEGKDYNIRYTSSAVKVGAYDVIIEGRGNYKGLQVLTYYITPKQMKIQKVSGGKEVISVTWKKQEGKCDFYEIDCSKEDDFSEKTSFVIAGSKTKASLKQSYIQSKKSYYIRIRSCTMIEGKRKYSKWSQVKKVSVK